MGQRFHCQFTIQFDFKYQWILITACLVMGVVLVIYGDCLEKIREIKTHSIDSVVTDPPAGISFMGKEWDDDKGGRKQWIAWMTEVMTECHRVLKPGGHGLIWAIPRTSHWTATALEDAGFEIRDIVTHLFGSGFPKSMDISKAIDKAAGAERPILGSRRAHDIRGGAMHAVNGKPQHKINITAPATDEAKQWQGWGTALKPASEHWILVRKPISEKTVAKNILKWGTGAINIDASRIETVEGGKRTHRDGGQYTPPIKGHINSGGQAFHKKTDWEMSSAGRFPANLILSHSDNCTEAQCGLECVVKMLDGQSGHSKSPGKTIRGAGGKHGKYRALSAQGTVQCPSDSGGASRFFYCAKAAKSDKGADNSHPTVKSTKLMTYLIQMITPPGGTVLDPFMGSGSTGVAALKNGFQFIGIEREHEYVQIARARMRSLEKGENERRTS